jgi:hypothetical protein
VTTANGNHSATAGHRGPFDAAFTSVPEATGTTSTEEFSWLTKGEPDSRPSADGPAWQEPADPGGTERFLRPEAEGLAAAQEPTDFWDQPLPQAPADLRVPAATPRAGGPPVTRASWTAAADAAPPAPPAVEPAYQPAADLTQPVRVQPVNTGPVNTGPLSTGTSQTYAAVRERDYRQDRYFPARLLAVIVIAALIGSALVLLLK